MIENESQQGSFRLALVEKRALTALEAILNNRCSPQDVDDRGNRRLNSTGDPTTMGCEALHEPQIEAKRFDTIVPLPSNVQAVESALLFATGRTPFVALVGPSGCGKSHLVDAAAGAIRAVDRSSRAQVFNAKEWATVANRIDPLLPLLIDNAQEAVGQHRSRLQLQLTLERRVKAGRPTLLAFTMPRPTRALKSFLPNHHAWVIATIDPPDTQERMKLVAQMSRREGLHLSESLQWTLARHLHGSGRTLEGAFKRLKLQDSHWLDARASLRALGVLNPCFVDDSNWDLREAILEGAERAQPDETARELAVFVMLRVALLAEADVAHYFELVPSAVYTMATRFERRLATSPELERLTSAFVEDVVERLSRA